MTELAALRAHLLAFDRIAHRPSDPVDAVHRFKDPRDVEVAAFLASMLAFGRVASVRASVARVLESLGPHPGSAVRALDARTQREALAGFRHRWCKADDIVAVLVALKRALKTHHTLERFFAVSDAPAAPDTMGSVALFYRRLAKLAGGDTRRPRSRGLEFLLPRRTGPSPFKRGHLFLRWVARPADGIDLGVWKTVSPRRLVVPLDTHVARIAANLGFTSRRTVGAPMALEVTGWLRRLDPDDPMRFDFALCHIGISGACPSRRQTAICAACGMRAYCRHWQDGDAPRPATAIRPAGVIR